MQYLSLVIIAVYIVLLYVIIARTHTGPSCIVTITGSAVTVQDCTDPELIKAIATLKPYVHGLS
uniref:Movement protein TGBp3 n=1 Tax=Paris polyphylla virus X TaxID=388066 RepID=Q19AW7_9VIRU|nr:triple-gene-block protein 3 [Paris polyphylla virus X]